MTAPHATPDIAATKAELRSEFPGWSIITTDRDRWWANRLPERDKDTGRNIDHTVTSLDADTPDELRALLTKANPR